MQNKIIIASAMVASVLFASSAMAAPGPDLRFAQHDRGYVGVNIGKADSRIDAGVRSGQLTQSEERQLRSELRALIDTIRTVTQDRKVTSKERALLERKEAQLHKNITTLSTNRQVAKRFDRDDRYSRYDNDHRNDDRRDFKPDQRDFKQVYVAPVPSQKPVQYQGPHFDKH